MWRSKGGGMTGRGQHDRKARQYGTIVCESGWPVMRSRGLAVSYGAPAS